MTVRRTQAERRAETERRVLDATIAIISEHGVRAVTMAAVGEAAGYSRGIVNHQFGTRQALMAAVAETVQSRFSPTAGGLTGRERVVAMAGDYLLSLTSRPQDARVFLRLWIAAIGGEEPELRPVFERRDEHFRVAVAGATAEGLRDGTIRADVDPPAAAVAIVGQLRGIALQFQLAPEAFALEAVREEVVAWTNRALAPEGD
jgi:AcrR family transcriptional regulator